MTDLPTPPVREIIRCEVGSTLHGIGIGSDDLDLMSVGLEPRNAWTGLAKWEHWTWRSAGKGERSQAGDVDWTLYGLRKYLRLACQGNPSVIVLLYAPDRMLHVCTDRGRELIGMRDAIVSQKCIPRFLGYLHGQREKARDGKAGRRGVREGRSEKWASHMVRLGYEAVEIVTTGGLVLPMREEFAAKCRAIKRGEMPFGEALDLAERLEKHVQAVEPGTPLREEPDYERINAWLHDVYVREHAP